jgi:hypothetical protein
VIVPLIIFAGALTVFGVVLATRYHDARLWRHSLTGYSLRLPSGLTIDDIARWLGAISVLTHVGRGVLLPPPPVLLEVVANSDGIAHRLFLPRQMEGAVLASLRAALPAIRLEPFAEDVATSRPSRHIRAAAQLRLHGRRQLSTDRSAATGQLLVASLQPLLGDEQVRWQWIMTGAPTPSPVATRRRSGAAADLPWWLDSSAPADADELRSIRLKQREPLLNVTGRLLVEAGSYRRARTLFGRALAPVRLMNLPGAQLVRSLWPSFLVRGFVSRRSLPLLGYGMRLNTLELAGLLAIPVGDQALPGIAPGVARQLPPALSAPRSGTVLADSTYPGIPQPLTIRRTDRLMHLWIGGPTGVGKSTLIANLALQDASAGDGFAVIDPKGDLIEDILSRLPHRRRDDVRILDPTDVARPVGFNILGGESSEAAQELAADHVLHVLRQLWPAFWGPRTDTVLRAVLLSLAQARPPDGSAFTLCEVAEALTNQQFRRWLGGQPQLSSPQRNFWRWFEGLSGAERGQVMGPVLNKVTVFSARTPLRLMLGQSIGLDLPQLMRQRKILLVPLSRGQLGAETAGLLGSLLVASLWQSILGRSRVPAVQRRPWWLYIDEAQEVVRLPVDVADMMAVARGLGVGLTLANQHLSQLPESVRRALLATVRSQVAFQLEPDDARILARAFAPTLSEQDLRSLPAHEVAMRLCVGGQTSRPVTGLTRPLPPAEADAAELRRHNRERYGRDRADVEAAVQARLAINANQSNGSFGRRRRVGGELTP